LPTTLDLVRHPPIFVFQIGKVGSSSLLATLSRDVGGSIEHAHRFVKFSAEGAEALARCRRWRLPYFVICPVRDPLSRNVSTFFENFERIVGEPFSARPRTRDELRTLLLERFNHCGALDWFDGEFRPLFGLDALAQPFDKVRRWQTYRVRSARILIYRTDLNRDLQRDIVGTFLGRPLGEWIRRNEAGDKDYGDAYADLCANARLPPVLIQTLHRSRFARAFWTEQELAEIAARWA
jgi:hypothetical protein